jgi:hypothetical protein
MSDDEDNDYDSDHQEVDEEEEDEQPSSLKTALLSRLLLKNWDSAEMMTMMTR